MKTAPDDAMQTDPVGVRGTLENEAPPAPEEESVLGAAQHEILVGRTVGIRVGEARRRRNRTLDEVARAAGTSVGMLSRIENAQVSPSLRTLTRLAVALNVPVTTFFRGLDEEFEASFVKAGKGLAKGPSPGHAHRYELLLVPEHARHRVLPHLVTHMDASEVMPLTQHDELEFVYMLKGRMTYRYGRRLYDMGKGDTLFHDGLVLHGPEQIIRAPVQYLTVCLERAPSGG